MTETDSLDAQNIPEYITATFAGSLCTHRSTLEPVDEGQRRLWSQLRSQAFPVLLLGLELQSEFEVLSEPDDLQQPGADGRTRVVHAAGKVHGCCSGAWREEEEEEERD